ncbi:MAG TPA: NADH-quinone oxidoreductase subunit NuoG [Alphaproteobacteria bacterium]|nr:NADH-quinone oxidoreductase subunit NuoG [Alphaproteobacteria bacterium]
MPKVTIDGREIEVPAGITVIQACEIAGIEIPRFCYHERLSVAGNCRMCLVQMEVPKSPKPIASCAMPVADKMVIRTDTDMVHKARRGVMEFLLINHPLDCPICDQGGECDLQDQAMAYGFDRSRFRENKRAVPEKYLGPLVKTYMTRCIHCTRCVRFATEVAGVEELGAVHRGEHMEITSYVERALTSELSGNIIDLCPVGALTSKPYAFIARPWELTKTESIDVHDAVGANVRIDARGREVVRVLPRTNEDVNEEWLADKGRFAYDGLKRQRLDRCFIRVEGRLRPATWTEAFETIAVRLSGVPGARMAAIAGDLADVEGMYALKGMMAALGSPHLDCRQDGAALDPRVRGSYVFNSTIAGIEKADACLLIGTNPRWEAPLINARLRKRWLTGGLRVGSIGPELDLTYPVERLGADPQTLSKVAAGAHSFASLLGEAKRPMLILGQGALARPDGWSILKLAHDIAQRCGLVKPEEGWNGFNVLHMAAARVGGLDLGFVPAAGGFDTAGILAGAERDEIELVFLLGADELPMERLGKAFVVYQGHHGDAGAHRADVILPGAAYTEKNGTYVNTEGRVQQAVAAMFPLGEAREDWKILRALSERLGHRLAYDSLRALRRSLYDEIPHMARIGQIEPTPMGKFGHDGKLDPTPFRSPIQNYYMTDPISRASETMAKCTEVYVLGDERRTGTHG